MCYNFDMAYIRKERGKVVKTVHVGSAKTEKGITKLLKKAQAIIDEEKTPMFNLDKFNG